MSGRLIDRVRDALAKRSREREPAARINEGAARSTLYPPAATIDVAPRTAPTSTRAPTAENLGGAREDERELGEDADSSR
jgi:hypothetical protein